MYVIISDNTIVDGPFVDIRSKFPNTSFPATISDSDLPANVYKVRQLEAPVVNLAQTYVPAEPIFDGTECTMGWNIVDLTPLEIQQNTENFMRATVANVQARLDTFARTRNYDGILSACTYATSNNPTFAAEGQRCVDLRDSTWSALYSMYGAVNAGTIPQPTSVQEILNMLPSLTWE